jgi:hypothetical protein
MHPAILPDALAKVCVASATPPPSYQTKLIAIYQSYTCTFSLLFLQELKLRIHGIHISELLIWNRIRVRLSIWIQTQQVAALAVWRYFSPNKLHKEWVEFERIFDGESLHNPVCDSNR